jgi:hypothetical protein
VKKKKLAVFREWHVNRALHNTAGSLMAKISEAMANLPRDPVVKFSKKFQNRITAGVVETASDFFREDYIICNSEH